MADASAASGERCLAELAARFPDAPRAELRRFATAFPNAAEAYEQHLAWLRGAGAPERRMAAARAVPPKFARLAGRARDGTRIVLLQGGRYDSAIDAEDYVLACAEAVEAAVSRDDDERVTVLIDARPGEGWPNPAAPKMVAFMRMATVVLPAQFPERIQRVIVYPMPWIMKSLWSMLQAVADHRSSERVVVLSGSASTTSPCPKELREFVELSEMPIDTHARHASLAA
mmetsp:Transcript_33714/g.95930  ORF Transcript_33714/g.95930 Transcript_33714/m.95930 type:complete len:229 (-) Transcript_33714:325-1011(-)